ncbi:MAG: endo-1,4-beta-xylanase [Prolixibacteraceae bacterium]|jgi:endo-1,4-beta-xylanase|nr:endo-1,4-beta-xylanase [Prolixibacteraceae bacterium]
MVIPGKREGVAKMIKNLRTKGITVDGIGIQGHFTMGFPSIDELEKSIEDYAALGCKVMITELDVSVLPNPWDSSAEVSMNFEYNEQNNPYRNGIPREVADALDQRYLNLFALFMKHSDKISRVTLWGISDGQSWKNNWPVRGRTDYPLLFNRDYQPKPVVDMIIQEAQN